MKLQDITFTVDLDGFTKDEYDALIRYLRNIGTGDIEHQSYEIEDNESDLLCRLNALVREWTRHPGHKERDQYIRHCGSVLGKLLRGGS